jgi:hypothetical protein
VKAVDVAVLASAVVFMIIGPTLYGAAALTTTLVSWLRLRGKDNDFVGGLIAGAVLGLVWPLTWWAAAWAWWKDAEWP